MYRLGVVEWHLVFRTEDLEAKERLRWIWSSLQGDPHVAAVEEYGIASPNCTYLKVLFLEGQARPQNPSFHHFNQVYGIDALDNNSTSSLDVLLSDELDQL